MPSSSSPVLLVSDDVVLRAEVARLAAAANVGAEALGTDEARLVERWRSSAAVLVGADAAGVLAERVPARRDDVWVVAAGTPGTPALRAALALGATGMVELPSEATVLGAWFADLGDRTGGPVTAGRVVGVLGASGGVGASVLALALAELGSSSGPAVLVDLDPWGLPASVLAGAAEDRTVGWADLTELEGRVGASALRDSLPARDELRVLGWGAGDPVVDLPQRVVREVVTAARRGHRWVVLDVPRGAATRELLAHCDAVVVVASSTLAGTAGAARVRGLVPDGIAAGVVVRPERGALPDEVARLAGLPLWGVLARQRGLDEHLAAGLGASRSRRSPCARVAHEVLDAVGRAVGGSV